MKIHLRVESRIGEPHATFTVFVNSVHCGRLTMRAEEFAIFEDCIEQGCVVRNSGDEFRVTDARGSHSGPTGDVL